jgi:hypothetical protein
MVPVYDPMFMVFFVLGADGSGWPQQLPPPILRDWQPASGQPRAEAGHALSGTDIPVPPPASCHNRHKPVSVPDPDLIRSVDYGSGSRRAKMTHQKIHKKNFKSLEISCFEVMDVLF